MSALQKILRGEPATSFGDCVLNVRYCCADLYACSVSQRTQRVPKHRKYMRTPT